MCAPPSLTLLLWCVFATSLGVTSGDVTKSSAPIVVQALNPTGIRISVPDAAGTSVVIINANINFPIAKRETGQVSGSALEPQNGFWSLETNDVTLKPRDVVFYSIYIAKGDKGDQREGHQPIHELQEPSCRPSPTSYNNGRTACAGQLLLEENFDNFNMSLWKHGIQFSDDPLLDFTEYTDNPGNSFVKDGKLHIKATVLAENELLVPTKLEKCTWTRGDVRGTNFCERNPKGWNILPPTRSAMLTTKGAFSFKFGRVEFRAKIAAGDWLLSRFWLEPLTNVYGRNPSESGRVITEIRGNTDYIHPDGRHDGARRASLQAQLATCWRLFYIYKACELDVGKHYFEEMHTFSITWTPEHMIMRVDDCEHEVKPPDGSFLKHGYFIKDCTNSQWEKGTHFVPFDQEFYIIMSLLPGGMGLYSADATYHGHRKPWSDEDPRAFLTFWRDRETFLPTWKSDFEVDSVKVWAL